MQPHRRQPTRLSRPWDSPGKNTGVGCQFLLQCMKVKSESEVAQSCPILSHPMDCSLPGFSVHGIFQAEVLEWGCLLWWCRRFRFNPWVGTIPWRRKWQPTPVFLPGKSHGQKSLVGYTVHGVTDTTEQLSMHKLVTGIWIGDLQLKFLIWTWFFRAYSKKIQNFAVFGEDGIVETWCRSHIPIGFQVFWPKEKFYISLYHKSA